MVRMCLRKSWRSARPFRRQQRTLETQRTDPPSARAMDEAQSEVLARAPRARREHLLKV